MFDRNIKHHKYASEKSLQAKALMPRIFVGIIYVARAQNVPKNSNILPPDTYVYFLYQGYEMLVFRKILRMY